MAEAQEDQRVLPGRALQAPGGTAATGAGGMGGEMGGMVAQECTRPAIMST
jgi:hypothetical protein